MIILRNINFVLSVFVFLNLFYNDNRLLCNALKCWTELRMDRNLSEPANLKGFEMHCPVGGHKCIFAECKDKNDTYIAWHKFVDCERPNDGDCSVLVADCKYRGGRAQCFKCNTDLCNEPNGTATSDGD